jgi:adenylate cyclase
MLEYIWPELAKAAATGALAGGASVIVQWAINRARHPRAGDDGDRATRLERRLAAILVADVVGYSRLTSGDEEGTHFRLIACRREIIEPNIRKHRGRIVKKTGDGALVEFGSVVDAVRCAVAVQRLMLARNAELPPSRRIEWRIGVNLGEIIVAPDDIYGHGVNIAARLESLAAPGGVCISAEAWRHVRGAIAAEFVDLGEHRLKNIPEPAHVFALAVAA